MSESLRGTRWRHKKRGSVYEIVDDDASIQVSLMVGEHTGGISASAAEWLEEEIWFAYRPVNGHKLFFRMREEFLDGRFERVADGA